MAVIGFSAKLSLNDGASQAFADMPEVTMITVPSQETTTVEVTPLGRTDPYKLFTPGLTDSGVLGFEANYTAALYSRLNAVLGKLKYTTRIPPTGTEVKWRITCPDEVGDGSNQTFEFNGILTKIELAAETEAVMKIKCEVKVNDAITVATAS